jgi:circadian clock protein KaiC
MPSSKNAKKSRNSNRLSSGIEELDLILGGGFPAKRLFLIEGAPGSGKTTLALQFLLAGAKNSEKGFYVTFSESEDEIRAVAESHGWTLDGIHLQELTTLGDRLKNEEKYTVFQPADVELSETVQRVVDDVRRLKPQRIVIDSLSEIRLVARDPLRYRRQILALKEILSECDCTVFFLEDYTVENPDLLLQSVAHGVLLLEKTHSEYGSVKRTLQVTKLRAGPSLEGSHDFAIRHGGLQVFRRLIASDSLNGARPKDASGILTTNNEQLDRLIGGGLRWGTGLVLVGPAGTGKSTVGIQIASAAAQQGFKTCAFLFDEAKATYIKRAKNVGLDLADYMQAETIEIHQVDPNEQSPGEFAYRVRRNVEDQGVRVVVIDSLNGYLTAMTSERFLLAQLHELLTYLNAHEVLTIITTGQHGMVNNTDTTSFELTYLADMVIHLRYFEASGNVRKAISVIKNRLSAHETSIREFEITDTGLKIGAPLRQFEGILSGTPRFLGEMEHLLNFRSQSGSKGSGAEESDSKGATAG